MPSFAEVEDPVIPVIRNTQTLLHDYNWKSEEMNTEGRNAKHKESETGKEDQVINVCTTICNVTEAGDVPITMGIIPTIAVHVPVCYKSLYISLPFSAKQQHEMTKFCVFSRTKSTTAKILDFLMEMITALHI